MEKAVFSDAKKADPRPKWALFLFLMLVLAAVYAVARDVLYLRLVHGYAQRTFNDLASASVEKIGSVSIDAQGDITLRDAEAYTHHKGARRLFFRTRELRLALDGMPLRDEGLHVMRIDLYQPEIFVRREYGGEWNLEWALGQGVPDLPVVEAEPAPPKEDRWKDYARPDESFPRNGVHIHEGIVHVTFVSKGGKEVTWRATNVRAAIRKVDGVLVVDPATGDFYGGRVKAYAELPAVSPLAIRQLTVDVADADVAAMAEGAPFLKRPVSGAFDAVLTLTVDPEKTRQRPIASGRCEIRHGDLWEFPALYGMLNLLTLTSVSNRRIDSAVLEFTVEEDYYRVDKMHFLGYPVSLFGDGTASLTGHWIAITFVPRLGKEEGNSILSLIGAPITLLSNVVLGLLVPVSLTGSFEEPRFEVNGERPVRPALKKLVEERGPK